MKRTSLLCLLLISFFSVFVLAQKKTEKFLVKVKISVGHDSNKVKTQIYNTIAKEIRALNDTTTDLRIVPNDVEGEDFTVEVTMVDVTQGGKRTGIAAAVSITEKAKCDFKWNKTNDKQNTPVDCNALVSTGVVIGSNDFEKEAKTIANKLRKAYGMNHFLINSDKALSN